MNDADDLREQAAGLINRAEKLDGGEELCNHHWNGSDRCYECYCPGCDKHIMEAREESDVPFKRDAYCYECSKTPEEKKAEKLAEERATKQRDLKKLAELRAQYPDA